MTENASHFDGTTGTHTASRDEAAQPIDELAELRHRLDERIKELVEAFNGAPCCPVICDGPIASHLVDGIFTDLFARFGVSNHRLVVVLDSRGGDIHSAYNLALLLRRYGDTELTIIVPRAAKSAAAMISCAGDRIAMTPVAELGPVDPQVNAMNHEDRTFGKISPLHIESALDLIRTEFERSPNLAQALMQRLQFPLTLGAFKTSLEVGRDYLTRLLSTRMLRDAGDEVIARIADRFTEGYVDHGYFIGVHELQEMGLTAGELERDELAIIWDIHLITSRRRDLQERLRAQRAGRATRDAPIQDAPAVPDGAGGRLTLGIERRSRLGVM